MAVKSDLEKELKALDERSTELGENDDLPRGKLPGLFRALRAASADEAERAAAAARKLGARLPDRALLEPIVELARDVPALREPLVAAIEARGAAPDAWASEKQARLLLGAVSRDELLPALEKLTREPPEGALPIESLVALVDLRLAASKRDRTSLELTRGALRRLAPHAREPRVAQLAVRVIEAETRRAGKEDPELALVALDVLAGAEPLGLLRAAKRLEKRIDRKKVQERAGALADSAVAALGAQKEDVADLLAEDLGLDASGTLSIPLEEGEALVSVAKSGEVVSLAAKPLAADDKREVEAAVSLIKKTRRDHADRLDRALAAGRTWRLSIFRAIFVENPLLRDLASRLVWLALPSKICFRPTKSSLEDVFGGTVGGLAPETQVRLAHPLELDPDELALWRERVPELGRQPFPQLHRLVRKETEKLDRFVGRELYQDDMAELGKKRGYRGLPLRGDGPWELAREMPGYGAMIVLTLDRVAGQVIVQKRKDALRVFDDPDAKPRERRDAAPRAKVAKVEVVGDQSVIPVAEAALDLHALTDPLEAGTDAFFGNWQKKKFKDPAAFWREAQLKMMRGSEAAVAVRTVLVKAFAPRVRVEGRLAILGGDAGLFIDLGTRQAFEGPLRDWVPPWKLDDRAPPLDLDWPFEPDRDEDTVRTVATVVSASRVVDSAPA